MCRFKQPSYLPVVFFGKEILSDWAKLSVYSTAVQELPSTWHWLVQPSLMKLSITQPKKTLKQQRWMLKTVKVIRWEISFTNTCSVVCCQSMRNSKVWWPSFNTHTCVHVHACACLDPTSLHAIRMITANNEHFVPSIAQQQRSENLHAQTYIHTCRAITTEQKKCW